MPTYITSCFLFSVQNHHIFCLSVLVFVLSISSRSYFLLVFSISIIFPVLVVFLFHCSMWTICFANDILIDVFWEKYFQMVMQLNLRVFRLSNVWNSSCQLSCCYSMLSLFFWETYFCFVFLNHEFLFFYIFLSAHNKTHNKMLIKVDYPIYYSPILIYFQILQTWCFKIKINYSS